MSLKNTHAALVKSFASSKPDLGSIKTQLTRAKIELTQSGLLVPSPADAAAHPSEVAMARDVLEIGALSSVRQRDVESFDRYMGLLHVFYNDCRWVFFSLPFLSYWRLTAISRTQQHPPAAVAVAGGAAGPLPAPDALVQLDFAVPHHPRGPAGAPRRLVALHPAPRPPRALADGGQLQQGVACAQGGAPGGVQLLCRRAHGHDPVRGLSSPTCAHICMHGAHLLLSLSGERLRRARKRPTTACR